MNAFHPSVYAVSYVPRALGESIFSSTATAGQLQSRSPLLMFVPFIGQYLFPRTATHIGHVSQLSGVSNMIIDLLIIFLLVVCIRSFAIILCASFTIRIKKHACSSRDFAFISMIFICMFCCCTSSCCHFIYLPFSYSSICFSNLSISF